jgi:hypothetical protein
VGKQLACQECDAQFDQPEDGRLTLVSYGRDPYGVGNLYLGKTFFAQGWAKLAAGLRLNSGNMTCGECEADWQYDTDKRLLKLLTPGRGPLPYAQPLVGRDVIIESWYLLLAGKTSGAPGYLCGTCHTEFDWQTIPATRVPNGPLRPSPETDPQEWVRLATERGNRDHYLAFASEAHAQAMRRLMPQWGEVEERVFVPPMDVRGQAAPAVKARQRLRLVRSSAPALCALAGETHLREDWYRLAQGLVTADQEQSLKADLNQLIALEAQEAAAVASLHAARRQSLELELVDLYKRTVLERYVSVDMGSVSFPIKAGEHVLWRSPGTLFRQRTVDGARYFDPDRTGYFVITNQRILLEDGRDPTARALNRISSVDLDYVGGLPALVVWVEGLKKPLAYQFAEISVWIVLEGERRDFTLAMADALMLLKTAMAG